MRLLSRLFSSSDRSDPLDELLGRASRDPDKRGLFYRALLDAELVVPGEIDSDGILIRPYTLFNRKTLLLFSSEKLAASLREQPKLIRLNGRTVLEAATRYEAVILNYGSRNEKELIWPEISAILDGSIFDVTRDGPQEATLLGQPKEYPVRLMTELQRALPGRPEIVSAYIAQMSRERSTLDPQIVIAFESTMNTEAFEIFHGNVARMATTLGEEKVLFVRLSDDPLGAYLRSETDPFYNRA